MVDVINMIDSFLSYLSRVLCPDENLEAVEAIASIDQGTQSSRVFLYNKNGNAIASSQETFQQHYPERGCVLHRPKTAGSIFPSLELDKA